MYCNMVLIYNDISLANICNDFAYNFQPTVHKADSPLIK